MSVIASPHKIAHIARQFNATVEDEHGNHPTTKDPPVIRRVMSITQFGRRGSSQEVVSADYALRTETTLQMTVADPPTYQPDDQVLLWPELDANDDYVPGSGIAYWVDGEPADDRDGPWPTLLSMFGGVVKLRRVT